MGTINVSVGTMYIPSYKDGASVYYCVGHMFLWKLTVFKVISITEDLPRQ